MAIIRLIICNQCGGFMLNSKHLHEKDAFQQNWHVSEEVVNQSEDMPAQSQWGHGKNHRQPLQVQTEQHECRKKTAFTSMWQQQQQLLSLVSHDRSNFSHWHQLIGSLLRASFKGWEGDLHIQFRSIISGVLTKPFQTTWHNSQSACILL